MCVVVCFYAPRTRVCLGEGGTRLRWSCDFARTSQCSF